MNAINATREPDPRGEVKKYFGKYPGIVLSNEPPEDAPHRGELRVQVPAILEELPPDGQGQRPIEVTALPCFHPGFFFIPETGAQVWVEFVAGDINSPLWTGVWYPTGAVPKTSAEEAPTQHQKVIRTAAGHVVQVDDTEGGEEVVIAHKSGARIQMDKDGGILISNKNNTFLSVNAKDGETTLFDEHKNLLTMKADGILAAEEGGTFIELKNGNMRLTSKEKAIQISAKDVILNASKISLGGKAAEFSLLLAETFASQVFDQHVHSHGPTGPFTGPPVSLLTPMLASGAVTSQAVKAI